MDGILLVNKKAGMTSHDVVNIARKKLNTRKIGHTGTLDPFATGLLILLIGNATKLAFLFDNLPKGYSGTIVFGKEYDTYDITGQVIDQNASIVDQLSLNKEITKLMPSYMQVPPIYSAIKKDGKKLIDMARKGQKVEVEPRLVEIYDFEITKEIEDNQFNFSTFVSKGTYIRSIAHDLGCALNTFGAIKELKRTKIGNYSVEDAVLLDDISSDKIIADSMLFDSLDKVKLNDFQIKLVSNGVYLDHRHYQKNQSFIAVNQEGQLIALYQPYQEKYKPVYFFKTN